MGEPEDEKKDKDMEELKNANKALTAKVADMEKKNDDEKKKREELEASMQAQIKSPIIDQILQAKKTLGLKDADLSAAKTSLEKFDVPTLQSMQAEFAGLAKAKESVSSEQAVRFPYQGSESTNLSASVEERNNKSKEFSSRILERCHNN